MRFVSTHERAPEVDLSSAIAAGLAPDGGLYVPKSLPQQAIQNFDDRHTLTEVAIKLLTPLFAGDALASQLEAICTEAFAFPAPLRTLATANDYVLELFHGPTAAFKDFGARFLAACMRRLPDTNAQARTILVATSGDTGAAVGAAFTGLAGFRVIILYPEGRVSPRQAHQLGVFADNVSALCLRASFDDCQRLVKQAFADTQLRNDVALSSANSISLGRLLPQMAYFAHSALAHRREHGTALNFVVPTGNLGNVFACTLARASGLPIGRIVLACNANDVLPNFFAGAEYTPRAGVATIANAMDVGAPSNFERLRWMYPDSSALRGEFRAFSVDDAAIRATIHEQYENYGQVFCPHTATAVHALTRLRAEGAGGDWAIAATAHPAKFDQIIEPLIGHPVAIPPTLNELLSRESVAEPLAVDYEAFRDHLLNPHQTSHK